MEKSTNNYGLLTENDYHPISMLIIPERMVG